MYLRVMTSSLEIYILYVNQKTENDVKGMRRITSQDGYENTAQNIHGYRK